MFDLLHPAARIGALALLTAASFGSIAQAQTPSWIIAGDLAAAKAEGELVVYGSMNEQEAFPFWKGFEDATGIKVSYVRGSDTQLIARIAIESRAQQPSWDLIMTTTLTRLPQNFLTPHDPPLAKELPEGARDKERRWYGVYANYNTPAYNTNLVKKEDLPQSYEDFAKHKEWAGKVAIDGTDGEWLAAMLAHYGEERGSKILKDIVATLNPIVVDGHLALARSVGSGEYWLALNNYASLTVNVKLAGAPTDFWALDPVTVFFGSIGMSPLAPHPKAALLASNYAVSKEGQSLLPNFGRIPVRTDVQTNPPGVLDPILKRKVVTSISTAEEQKKYQTRFNEFFKPR
jgi:iron(III) transport system substrate-binding protein